MANNETLPEFKKSNGKAHDQLGDSESDLDRRLLELAAQEENTEEWRRKFKKMSKELAKKTANQDTPDKNDEQYNNQSLREQLDSAPKDKLITAVRTKLTAFSGPLSSRAKSSLSSLDTKWYSLSDDSKQGALDTLGVISSNIEVFGNAGEDPVGAIRGAIDIVASISSNFGPKGQLASTALGFVSALLGLFGKGPKPKPLGQVVREQIDEALAQYREEELVRKKDGLLSAFQLTKAYLDGAAKSGQPLSTEEVPVATKEMERSQGVAFMGELASEVRKMFRNNKAADARKAIRYCEMYAQLAVYREIIFTQYLGMLPTTATWQNHLNGVISDRAMFRRLAGALIGKLYTVEYESAIIPYFDPDVSVITDAFSTKVLNLGKYDRSMAGLHCLMTPGRGGLEDLEWQRRDSSFKTGGNPYTTIVKPSNYNCYWKLVPHGRHTYSIINKYKCKEKYDYCGSLLSWTRVSGKAYVDIASDDPVLWEIWGYDWK
ncbi:Toxin CrTX-A [Exaiptasia diaphana]|nr:Toxin CrTX-A [Exaiptasia diaphana]